MKKIHILIAMMLLSTLFMAMTCEDSDVICTDVTFMNNSQDTLYVAHWSGGLAPDISPRLVLLETKREFVSIVLPYEKKCFKIGIPDDVYKGEITTSFLIFKNSTMKNYSDEELAEKNIYDKKMFFTYKELENKKFLVEYDGN